MTAPVLTTRLKATQSPNIPGLNTTVATGGTGYVQVVPQAAIIARVVFNGGTNAGTSTAALAGNATVAMDTGAAAQDVTVAAAASGVTTGAAGGLVMNLGEGVACPKGFGVNLANATDSVTVFWK